MKKINTIIIVCLIFLSACKNDTNDIILSTSDQNTSVQSEAIIQENTSIDPIIQVSSINDKNDDTNDLSASCIQLKAEYEKLINSIVDNKTNKELLNSLVSWTKNPKHLNCIEEFSSYSAFVESTNEKL